MLVQVDRMVRERGVFHMKTEQERQLEKRVQERKQQLMEEYRAQKEQRKASQHLSGADPHRSSDGREELSASMDGGGARNGMEDRVAVSPVHNPAPPCEREVSSKPSPRLNAGKTWLRALILLLKAPQPDQNGGAYVCA